MHLIIDGNARNKHLMTTVPVLRNWLLLLAEKAGMRVHGTPMVTAYPWPGSADSSALSGVCFLEESSITVHCYPEQEHVFVDVFSCQDFNCEEVAAFVRETFDMPTPQSLLLQRGVKGLRPIPTTVL